MERVPYDEFVHVPRERRGVRPALRRAADRAPRVGRGRPTAAGSARSCGETRDPELVFLHGGAQNAHTWDTVAMALDRPWSPSTSPGTAIPTAARRRLARRAGPTPTTSRWRSARWRPNAAAVDRHVARRADDDRARPTVAPSSCARWCSSTSRPGVNADEVEGDRRLHQRSRELRQLRRPAGPHDRVQPDPDGVVAAPRASCTTPSSATTARWVWRYAAVPRRRSRRRRRRRRRRHRDTRLRRAVGRGRPDHGAAAARRGACASSRWSTTTTRRSCSAACPTPGSSTSRRPATACRATPRSSWRSRSRSSFTASRGDRGSPRSRR